MRLKELAATRSHYGYRRLHILLKREGSNVNAKRIYRLHTQERLSLRTKKPRRRVSCRAPEDRPEATRINDCWAMDFMSDELYDGRRMRLLTIVDHFTRESFAIDVGQRIRGNEVVSVLERVACHRKLPKSVRVDNGTELRSKVLDQWAHSNGVTLDFSRPGKPTDNAFIESFNGSVRAECLNENWFLSLDDAKQKSKLGELTTTNNDHIAFWVTCPPKNSLYLAGLARTHKDLILTHEVYQKLGHFNTYGKPS
ncbi:IS3 family transposase, partial [bacterium]|nr:IS3 family transposase [bacterium]